MTENKVTDSATFNLRDDIIFIVLLKIQMEYLFTIPIWILSFDII